MAAVATTIPVLTGPGMFRLCPGKQFAISAGTR
jgi:hypothetical protein